MDALPVGPIIERGYDVNALGAAMAGHARPLRSMLRNPPPATDSAAPNIEPTQSRGVEAAHEL
ncbi:hypothetical protein [Rhodococcus marinonascens]|uniref:hypothetical protein n=1 Tax=Rhodococcus marinonascens TaxID=38311 RepID=UPI001472D469|nr:hypothetical protein [Rhodococcus marinonascens]